MRYQNLQNPPSYIHTNRLFDFALFLYEKFAAFWREIAIVTGG